MSSRRVKNAKSEEHKKSRVTMKPSWYMACLSVPMLLYIPGLNFIDFRARISSFSDSPRSLESKSLGSASYKDFSSSEPSASFMSLDLLKSSSAYSYLNLRMCLSWICLNDIIFEPLKFKVKIGSKSKETIYAPKTSTNIRTHSISSLHKDLPGHTLPN